MTATTVAASRPQSNKQSLWRRFVKGRGLSYCVLAVIGVFWIFPFLWMALGSLKTQREILAKPPKLLPEHASLANFAKWFGELNFGTYFTNSIVVAVITVLGNMVFCSMVGYALAKMDFAGKNILFGAVMVTLMVPSVARSSFVRDDLEHGTRELLCGAHPAVPVSAHRSLPDETVHLRNPRRADGGREGRRAGELRIFFQIVLPQCGPPLATLSILTFLSSWNNFLWPLVAAQTEEKYTLPVALSLYSTGQNATNYSVLLAGAVLVVTPILLLFVFLQRYFIQASRNGHQIERHVMKEQYEFPPEFIWGASTAAHQIEGTTSRATGGPGSMPNARISANRRETRPTATTATARTSECSPTPDCACTASPSNGPASSLRRDASPKRSCCTTAI